MGTEGIDKQTTWKHIWYHYQGKTKVKVSLLYIDLRPGRAVKMGNASM